MKRSLHFFALLFLSLSLTTLAQSYEIRAVNKGAGFIGVEMRSTKGTPPSTNNALTDFVFGLKWLSSYNVDLATSITTGYNIKKSDVRKQKDSFDFQAFYADNTPLFFSTPWTPGNWVEIMSVRNTRIAMSSIGYGTFAIAENGFDPTTDPNISVDLVDYRPVIDGSALNVLLVRPPTRLKVMPVDKAVNIQWTTAGEKEMKGYEVQRSEGEAVAFKPIGWIESKGDGGSENRYEMTDKEVVASRQYYYRLKLVDGNGQASYSEVKTAMLDELDSKAIRILPNPADKLLQVFFDKGIEKGTVTLKVVDAKGAVVLSQSRYIDDSASAGINVSALAGGQYFLVIERNNETLCSKAFQKQ